MEAKKKPELIPKLLDEQRGQNSCSSPDESGFAAADSDDHSLLVSELASEMDAIRGNVKHQPLKPPADLKELPSLAVGEANTEAANELTNGAADDGGREEIIRELRDVKRQNLITHCLLSTLIVITVGLQLSQVSLVLKVKQAFTNPFRSFGSMLTGMLKGPTVDVHDGKIELKTKKPHIEIEGLPPLNFPELPNFELPSISVNVED